MRPKCCTRMMGSTAWVVNLLLADISLAPNR